MEPYFFPALLVLIGVFFLIRNIIFLRDEEKLRKYLEKSPKAKLWVKKFGIDKTVDLAKSYFLPLGVLISCCLFGVGVWSLFISIK